MIDLELEKLYLDPVMNFQIQRKITELQKEYSQLCK
jgi:hypothetical protein